MRDIKFKRKSRYFIFSLLQLLFSIALLSVTALGTTLAWFSDSSQLEYNGTTATVSAQVLEGSTPIASNVNLTFTNNSSGTIKIKNTSNINAYIRVFISCNWHNNSAEYGDVTTHITSNISSTYWHNPSGRAFVGQFIYYKGAVAPNEEKTITSAITLTSIPEGSGGVDVTVWVEAVQANSYGASAFASTDAGLNTATWLA